MKRRLILALGLLVATVAATGAVAQTPAPGRSPESLLPPDVQAKLKEVQELEERLDHLRMQALAKPEVKRAADALQAKIEAALKKDPETAKKLVRYDQLRAELEQASRAGDRAKGESLMAELDELGRALGAAQRQVFKDAALAAEANAVNDKIMAEMKRLEPKTPDMMKRAALLGAELRSAKSAHGDGHQH